MAPRCSNFPARTVATECILDDVVQLAGVDVPAALDAICAITPLDFFVDEPVLYMAPAEGDELPPAGKEVHDAGASAILRHSEGVTVSPLPRFDFYERASNAFVIVQCSGERRRTLRINASATLPPSLPPLPLQCDATRPL